MDDGVNEGGENISGITIMIRRLRKRITDTQTPQSSGEREYHSEKVIKAILSCKGGDEMVPDTVFNRSNELR